MAEQGHGDPFELEEERFDVRRLGRAALWALGAAVALVALGAAAQSETGARRMAAALDALPGAWRPTAPRAPVAEPQLARATPADTEARRLADTVRLLSADRDRLLARLEALERNLDVTGSIPNQPAARSASPVATDGATAMQSGGRGAEISQAAAAESVATRTEFGVDLGGDSTLDGLRTLWSTLKAQHATALDGLRPIIAVREGGKAGAVELRLVAGPLANAAAAARLCAALTSALAPCQPTTFDGQRLALR